MRYRGTELGRFKRRGMVGTDGTTYGNAALYTAEEITAMLANGVVEEPSDPIFVPDPVEELKKAKKNAKRGMKEIRAYIKFVQPLAFDDGTLVANFDTDATSIANMLVTIAAFDAGEPLPTNFKWTDADDNDISVTADQMRAVIRDGFRQGNQAHKTYRQIKRAINQATTIEEVQAIEWPWPDGVDPRGVL